MLISPRLTVSAAETLHVESHRDRFHERALRDVTVNSNDAGMMLDPSDPLLVKEEMDAQKVRLYASASYLSGWESADYLARNTFADSSSHTWNKKRNVTSYIRSWATNRRVFIRARTRL